MDNAVRIRRVSETPSEVALVQSGASKPPKGAFQEEEEQDGRRVRYSGGGVWEGIFCFEWQDHGRMNE
eukprot:1594802-Pyramimonas_sp.AAC.1